jgi:hypothetical protein
MDQHQRFTNKVNKAPSGCWEWIGGKFVKGYGQFYWDGVNGRAHRYSYEYFVAKIPKGLTIDHLCNNKSCVNPNHLEAVTMKINVLRSNGISALNSRKVECLRGHKLTKENTLVRISSRGKARVCLECRKNANRTWRLTH